MNTPEPSQPPNFLQTITDLAKTLPPPLRFVIVFTLLLIMVILFGAAFPDNLIPLVYGLAAVGFIGYLWWEYVQLHHKERAEQRAHELKRLAQEQQHQLATQPVINDQQTNKSTNQQTPQQTNPPPSQSTALPDNYLRYLSQQCGFLNILTVDPRAKDASELDLDQVFTTLDVDHPTNQTERSHDPSPDYANEGRIKRQPVLERLSDSPRLVLLGKPGSGKSTLVKFITYCLAEDKLGNDKVNANLLRHNGWKKATLLPIRIVLREYAARGLPNQQTLMQFVEAELKEAGQDLHTCYFPLENHFKQKGGLLLLDGLDEVPDAYKLREDLRKFIEQFNRDFPYVNVLVTSRPYAYADAKWQLSGYDRAELQDFTPDQINYYVENWYRATAQKDRDLSLEKATRDAEALRQDIDTNKNIADLAPHPLLLALMTSLHHRRGGERLPEKREKLYDESVELLIESWEKRKKDEHGQINVSISEAVGISFTKLRKALSEVAYKAHKNQAEATKTADILADQLVAVLYKHKDHDISVEVLLKYVQNRSGILVEQKQAEGDSLAIYSFPHRTFQEYLTACYMLENRPEREELPALIQNNLTQWREVAVLIAERDNSGLIGWQLANRLSAHDQSGAKNWGGVFLAGKILKTTNLRESSYAEEQNIIEQVRGELVTMLSQNVPTPRDRAEGGGVLAWLGDPRQHLVPQSKADLGEMGLCAVPKGAFWGGENGQHQVEIPYDYWLGQYPVTVGQFKLFLTESDHEFQGYHLFFEDALNSPARFLKWYDALAFCRWLTKEWQLPANYAVTLPSELEWEKGARGGWQLPQNNVTTLRGLPEIFPPDWVLAENPLPKRTFPWGDEAELTRANVEELGINAPSPLGMFPDGTSAVGCQEMSGNVWEWTRTHWAEENVYLLDRKKEDLTADDSIRRVVRGNAYYNDIKSSHCAVRDWFDPTSGSTTSVFGWQCPPLITPDLFSL